jgi:hypothetical protein
METTHDPPVDGGGVLPPITSLWTQWLQWTHKTTEKTGSGLAAGAGGDLGFPMEYIGFFLQERSIACMGPQGILHMPITAPADARTRP